MLGAAAAPVPKLGEIGLVLFDKIVAHIQLKGEAAVGIGTNLLWLALESNSGARASIKRILPESVVEHNREAGVAAAAKPVNRNAGEGAHVSISNRLLTHIAKAVVKASGKPSSRLISSRSVAWEKDANPGRETLRLRGLGENRGRSARQRNDGEREEGESAHIHSRSDQRRTSPMSGFYLHPLGPDSVILNCNSGQKMGLFDKLRGEFIDIIEWTDDSRDTMVWRFERHNNEIKNGAKLTVRESQVAVFVNEGQIADVFPPGMHTLDTQNLPILSTLQGWKYGFNSPFKAEVYFVNTRRFTDLKWGTPNPIMMRDQDFGLVRVRAFGSYSMKVADAGLFLKEVVGTNWEFTTDDISEQCRSFLISGFADALGTAKIPVLDLVGKYGEMGAALTTQINPKFAEHGLQLINLTIENVSVPPEVEQAIDKRSSMGAIGNLNAYMQYQAAESLTENPGGMGAMGAQMAAGMAVGQQLAGAMAGAPPVQGGAPVPPPVPSIAVHVAVDGASAGPFDTAGLKGLAASGKLTGETLVWQAGMAGWTAAKDVPAVSAVLGSVPPPIPGA